MLLFVLLDTWLILGLNEKHIQWEALLEKLGESRWEENDKSLNLDGRKMTSPSMLCTWPAGMAVHIRKESTWNIAWEMNAFLYIS